MKRSRGDFLEVQHGPAASRPPNNKTSVDRTSLRYFGQYISHTVQQDQLLKKVTLFNVEGRSRKLLRQIKRPSCYRHFRYPDQGARGSATLSSFSTRVMGNSPHIQVNDTSCFTYTCQIIREQEGGRETCEDGDAPTQARSEHLGPSSVRMYSELVQTRAAPNCGTRTRSREAHKVEYTRRIIHTEGITLNNGILALLRGLHMVGII